MKKHALLFLILILSHTIMAQKHFLQGFIVQHAGDTIQGFIGYNNWNDNPDYVNFRFEKEGETKRYFPKDILAFSVEDDLYESAQIKHETSPRGLSVLKSNPDIVLKDKRVFLRILYKGDKTLAHYKTHSGIANFYIYYKNKYTLLIYKKYYKNVDGKKYIETNKKYIGQLQLYLNNCSNQSSNLSTTPYSEAGVTKLFENYYKNCSNNFYIYRLKEERDLISWSVFAGVVNHNIWVSRLMKTDYTTVYAGNSITFGGAFEITFKRSFQHWSINNELMYSSFKASKEGADPYFTYLWQLNYTYLSINNMFRYQYKFGDINVFANIGITNGFAIAKSSTEKRYNKITKRTTISDLGLDKKNEIGMLFGIGARFKEKYQAEVRAQTSTGMSPYLNVSTAINRFFVMFSYRF